MPESLKGIGYYQGISLILWYIVIILLFVSSCLFLIRTFMSETKSLKMAFLAYSILGLFFGLTRLVYIIAVHQPQNYDFYVILGYIFNLIGIIFWLFVLETYVIKFTKKLLTTINLIAFVIGFITLIGITNRYFALMIYYIFGFIFIGSLIFLYLYLVFKTTSIARRKSIGILVGIILVFISHFMDSEFFITSFRTIPLEITPIIMIIGIIIYTGSQMLHLKNE